MGKILDYIFDNAYEIDAKEVEAELRQKYPSLFHADEKVLLAFRDRGGLGRDREYFTTHRIVFQDGKGIGKKRKNFSSIPYSSIQAWSVETAGKLDGDVELKIWARSTKTYKINFATDGVDIFKVQQFLNGKVSFTFGLGTQDEIDAAPPDMDQKQSAVGNAMDWLGDNAMQVDSTEVESKLKADFPVLCAHEKVEIAFKSGRDTTLFTDRRIMIMNVKGLSGNRIEFQTVLWSSIHGFEVATAGAFLDRDTEVTLYTNIIKWECISQDLRNGKANLFGLQKILCNHILGEDTDPLPEVDRREGQSDPKSNWWFKDNQRPLDAVEMDRVYHSDPPILQGSETVEFAFKGRRDITMFTTKRLLMIDPQGITGKKISYKSIPWNFITAFAIRTAGKYLDFDTEVCFFTDMCFYPGEAGHPATDDEPAKPPIPARPLMSCFEIDFNKNLVDMYKLKYYLSKRILLLGKIQLGAPIPLDALTTGEEAESEANFFDKILGFIGNDNREIDARALDRELHTAGSRILLEDETCLMAFKAGRDISIFTNLRVMTLDVQGLSGKKIQYTSIPLKTIRGFSVETSGTFDTDTELELITRNRWHLARIKMDFRSGKADIIQINKFLSALVIGLPSDKKVDFGKKSYESHGETHVAGANSLAASFFQNAKEVNATEVDTMLRTSPALLLDEEKVLRAFNEGRDMTVYTTRRKLLIDTKGFSGKRVKYETIPYKWVAGYEFEKAGHLDWDAELYVYTDVSEVFQQDEPRVCHSSYTKNSILTKDTDIFEVGGIMNDYILMGKFKEEPEIEIDFEPLSIS